MSQLLQYFIWIPFIGFVISLLIPRKNEYLLSGTAIATSFLHFAGILVLFFTWLRNGDPALDAKHLVLFKSGNIEIFIDFYFDSVTAVFALVGSAIASLVSVFSRYYMHREAGFKRFFVTMLLFFLGYNLVIFSGNFETLFVGWEILGICSFLLIAFYRDRYLPVKNGLKVISFFRLADVCLLLAMWMSHHLWHENITFVKLSDPASALQQLAYAPSLVVFISVMILLAALIKSAQLPFSSWLPRAMEGPTTSSAIFYGSLSVHIGVFILLRTYPFWESITAIKVIVIVLGLLTALIATGIARVQSTVKTQIAYSSIAQIGIIFVEVALGFHVLALIHFAGNAFLRTYQLLVSPSVLSYLTHDQFYNFKPGSRDSSNAGFKKIMYSLYVLNIREWDLDFIIHRLFWNPFKLIGRSVKFLANRITWIVLALVYGFGLYYFFTHQKAAFHLYLPYVFAFLGLILILKAFAERGDARRSFMMVFASQFFIAFSIALNTQFELNQIAIYLSGGIVSAVVGYICLSKIRLIDQDIDLDKFHGYAIEKPKVALIFLIACLGLVAFPITPAFIGFDILLTHIHQDQIILILCLSLCFVFIELSILRIYARIFLGQHKKAYHPIAFRSS
jgi:NADH-quinone oxidoreductase subunit L